MRVKPLSKKFEVYLREHQLIKKFNKQVKLFESNPRHPSLNTELLEPKSDGVYSFRIDKKYRALFIIVNKDAEIVDINLHYQ